LDTGHYNKQTAAKKGYAEGQLPPKKIYFRSALKYLTDSPSCIIYSKIHRFNYNYIQSLLFTLLVSLILLVLLDKSHRHFHE
jgi:hypothetical protein